MKKLILSLGVLIVAVTLHAQDGPKGLNVNDKAPEFSAKSQDGKPISLKEKLKAGPVVLVFYRGQWCPYCNRELKNLEDSLSLITAKGATLIAVTPEKPENISKTIEKTKATYPILFDEGLKIMKSYDVAFAVDPKTIEKYKGYGIDFNEVNGANGTNLPVPAVYIINKNGGIIYKYFDADYRKRPSVKDLLDHL
ncbi:MAG: AhpC/TSA family protein [Chitinophagaceae bacterium]|nr:AhpC/TSA family protein [Chitinophagaceae bacterium]